jgi:ATP-dependent Clp protease, protease subunit
MREIIKAKEHIARMIAHATGKAIEIVCADIERDYWMDAEEAIQYGLVSKIIEHRAQLRGCAVDSVWIFCGLLFKT